MSRKRVALWITCGLLGLGCLEDYSRFRFGDGGADASAQPNAASNAQGVVRPPARLNDAGL